MNYLENGILGIAVEEVESPANVNHPLGLRRVSDTLAAEVFPGLSVYTRRAKYFSLLTYWQKMGWLKNHESRVKLDALMTFYSNHNSTDSESLVGKEVMKSLAGTDQIDPKRLENISIPSFNQYRNPLRECNFLFKSFEANTDIDDINTLISQVSIGGLTKSKIDKFIKNDKKLDSSMLRYLKKWEMDSFSENEKRIIRNMLGIGKEALVHPKGINRSISLVCIQKYYERYNHMPRLGELIQFSKRLNKKVDFTLFSSSILDNGINVFSQVEVYDLYLLCLDIAFNAIMGEIQTGEKLDLEYFRFKEKRYKKIPFKQIKDNFIARLMSLKRTEKARRSSFILVNECIQMLKVEHEDVWQNINRLLTRKKLIEIDQKEYLVDWLLNQHWRYTKERSISSWIIKCEDNSIHCNPENLTYDYWHTIENLEPHDAFRYFYRLGSINRLLKDII